MPIRRKHEVAALRAQGAPWRRIAKQLHASVATVFRLSHQSETLGADSVVLAIGPLRPEES